MRALLAAAATVALFAGGWLVLAGLRGHGAGGGRPQASRRLPAAVRAVLGLDLPPAKRRRHQQVLAAAVAAGALLWLFTGWVIALVAVPAAAVGLPALLRAPAAGTDVDVLTGLESWTRGLSGVLTVGAGIEQAILTSLPSAPESIRPAVEALVARLRARWTTADALRAFADDLDDATGDLVAGALILGAHRRGPGLVAVLDDLAATVAEEVRIRRGIEADRAKPRTTARLVTLITLGVLGALALTGGYVAPYGSGIGQLTLVVLLSAYVGCLLWMRAMSAGEATPRFLPATSPGGP